jgi:hypothetical protein
MSLHLGTSSRFPGFPYFITRIVPAMYHVIVLPSEYSERELQAFAGTQTLANRLEAALVLADDRGFYFYGDDVAVPSACPPWGGAIVTGQLAPAIDFVETDDLRTRRAALDVVAEAVRKRGGYMLGDLTCGGRPATDDEVRRLSGVHPDGAPAGLVRCDRCGERRGVCLSDRDRFPRLLLTVHCRCDNHNRCARCGEPLHEHRLNANVYDERAKCVLHVPGFSGLSHRCVSAERRGNDR